MTAIPWSDLAGFAGSIFFLSFAWVMAWGLGRMVLIRATRALRALRLREDQRRQEVFVIPDILCNAGGVVVSYFEWVQDLQQFFWDEAEVMDKLYHVLQKAFAQVMTRADRDGVSHRTAAMAIGVQKVRDAKAKRGLFP